MPQMSASSSVTPSAAAPVLAKRSGLDVHALSRPAGQFTGDFYFTHRRGERLWFAVGDVAGKGLDAAVVMALIQEELEHRIVSCARMDCDPAATVTRLHEFLMPLLPGNKFATVIIGNLHEDGSLRLANGGHCPALIARSDSRVEEIGSTGPVTGLVDGRWTSVRANLAEGDALLLFSDGLLEGRSPEGEEFGLDRIIATARGRGNARELARRLTTAFDAHTAQRRDDDLTILAIRR